MSTETYRNAPITEAALDVRVRLGKETNVDVLETIKDEKYPILHQRPVNIEFKIVPGANGAEALPKSEVSNTPLGFSYMSEDRKQVFQIRTDGFTHNRLAPYIDWNSFSQEAKRLWTRYIEVAQPETIEILGLNYLNQIFVPHKVKFERYFRTYIQVAPDLPQTVNTYNLSYQLSWPNQDRVMAFVGQGLGPPIKEGFATMVLNIQAFKQLDKAAKEVEGDEIWETFNLLRNVKNSVFEACITELVREEIR